MRRFSGDSFKDRGHAAEELWFTQHEAEMMQRMLKKVQAQQESITNPKAVTEARKALIGIFEKHNAPLSPELAEDLRSWRVAFKAGNSKA
eukprot:jgi/Bigna1/125699/aug1.1_g407